MTNSTRAARHAQRRQAAAAAEQASVEAELVRKSELLVSKLEAFRSTAIAELGIHADPVAHLDAAILSASFVAEKIKQEVGR